MNSKLTFLATVAIFVGAGIQAAGTETFQETFEKVRANFSAGAAEADRAVYGDGTTERERNEAAREFGERRFAKTTGHLKKMYNQTLDAMNPEDREGGAR